MKQSYRKTLVAVMLGLMTLGNLAYAGTNAQNTDYAYGTDQQQVYKPNVFRRYFGRNHTVNCQWLHVGYGYNIGLNSHTAEVGLFNMRFAIIGLAPLDFEADFHPFTQQVYYRPNASLYIPVSAKLAFVLHGGVIMSGNQLYMKYIQKEESENPLSMGWFTGLSFDLRKSLSIYGEYRQQFNNKPFTETPEEFNGFRVGVRIGY